MRDPVAGEHPEPRQETGRVDRDSNPEIIVDGETGLLVATADPSQLSDAMMRIWCDPELGRRMGLAGRRRVEEHFDVRRMVANYEAIYDELSLHSGRSSAGQTVRQAL